MHRSTYTTFNKVKEITESDKSLNVTYGPDYARKKSVITENGNISTIKYYSGNYEKVIRGNSTEERHYISGNDGVIAVFVTRSDQSSNLYYLHKDHLGSVLKVSDESGNS